MNNLFDMNSFKSIIEEDIRISIQSDLLNIYEDVLGVSVKQIVNMITYQFIRADYYSYSKRESLAYWIGDVENADALKSQLTRNLKKLEHDRAVRNAKHEGIYGYRIKALEQDDINGQKRFNGGHNKNEVEYLQIRSISELTLINRLWKKTLFTKNTSAERFAEIFDEYIDYVLNNEPKLNDYKDVICKSILINALEEDHHINLLALFADEASSRDYDYKNIPIRLLNNFEILVGAPFPVYGNKHIKNRFTTLIPEHVKNIFERNGDWWQIYYRMLRDVENSFASIFNSVPHGPQLMDIMHRITDKEKAEFFINDYWVWNTTHNPEWNLHNYQIFREISGMLEYTSKYQNEKRKKRE